MPHPKLKDAKFGDDGADADRHHLPHRDVQCRDRDFEQASVIKLHASEMAGRVLDKAVQIFGGRGYMRENPVERLNRDVRVDRIWEGTSEIQRMIIGGQLGKRGPGLFTGWFRRSPL